MGKTIDRKIVPPLRDGDELTRKEFWRRYKAVRRAELIDGIVHLISTSNCATDIIPLNARFHSHPHFLAIAWLGYYAMATTGVKGVAPTTVKSHQKNSAPEPDGCLYIREEFGGQSKLDRHGYLVGAAELVLEISNTTVAHDLGKKRDFYFQEGVKEYIVWRTQVGAIDWFVAGETEYRRHVADADGLLKSQVFPGLWLDEAALLKDDMHAVQQAVQRGLATPEHAEFVSRLQRARANPSNSLS